MLPLYLAVEGTPVEESGPNPVIPNVGELIIGLLTFAIVVFVLMKYAWPRMEATFQVRRDAIEGGIKRAEEAQAEAQRLLGEYRQQLSEARTEAAQIRDNARAEGQRIIEEMRTTAQEESVRIVARGEEQLTMQRQQVVRELRGEIGTLATGLAERVVGETLADDPARQRTIDRFLDDLDVMAQSVPAGVGAGTAAGLTGSTGDGSGGAAPAGGSTPGGSTGDAADGGATGGATGGASGGSSSGGSSSGGSAPDGGVGPGGGPTGSGRTGFPPGPTAGGSGSTGGGSGGSGGGAGGSGGGSRGSGGGAGGGPGPDESGGRGGGGRSRRRG
jgi:F-type H+-transporting ATPase subunit b